ncbi:hypothetical protein MKX01_005671, partial [Papaver californicum]
MLSTKLSCAVRPHYHYSNNYNPNWKNNINNNNNLRSNILVFPNPSSTDYSQRLSLSSSSLFHNSNNIKVRSKANWIPGMMEKVDSETKLFTRMRLWEFPDQYVIEPTDGSTGSCLTISRVDGAMSMIDEVPHVQTVRAPRIQTVFGVMGLLKLLAGVYVIVITERECVGSYLGHPIFKVSSLKILPCDHSLNTSSAEQKKMESEFSVLLSAAERTTGLYFSYDVNLTLSAQRLHDLGEESKRLPLWRQADPRYLWNNYMLEVLIDNKVRGSIPLLWEQVVDLTYKPKFELVRLEEAPRVVERHFLDLRKRYGSVLAVDLVNKHGGEGRLCEKYGDAMQHVVGDDTRYLHFDFHQICGHVHFERLSMLYDQIEDFLKKNGYLFLNGKGEKVDEQLGVVRTNCIDCLDRTNVTQSMIARRLLENQLRRVGIFRDEETISTHQHFDECFKIMWANHGDDVSIQYSGTPALKGDYVRCGQRTIHGIVKDGWNALARYYLNNFCDGTKQDAIDLLQGHYIVSSVNQDMTPPQVGGLEAYA